MRRSDGLRIVYFGTYSRGAGYPRSRVLMRALAAAGAEVVECHAPVDRSPGERAKLLRRRRGWISLPGRILAAQVRLSSRLRRIGPFDMLIVGCAGQLDVPAARLLARGRPVVLDAFLSLYDTLVDERRLVPRASPIALGLRTLDRVACRLSDAVILDTDAHIDYFVRTFGQPRRKFIRALVGEDDALFSPRPAPTPSGKVGFNVLFFGTYLALHGTETIVRAAKRFEDDPDLRFTLIGTGPAREPTLALAGALGCGNIDFIDGWTAPDALVERIARADVCLGIFGTNAKAGRVIPCKVFDTLAMGRPVVTRRSPAAEELLVHDETALLCPPGDPAALASAIRRLRNDPALGIRLGRAGLRLYETRCSPSAIGPDLLEALEQVRPRTGSK